MPTDDDDCWIPLAALTRNVVVYLAPRGYQSAPRSELSLSDDVPPSQNGHVVAKSLSFAPRLCHNTAHGRSSGNGNDRPLSATKEKSWARLFKLARYATTGEIIRRQFTTGGLNDPLDEAERRRLLSRLDSR